VYKSPGTGEILAELNQAGCNTLYSEIHRLINSVWNKTIQQHWKGPIILCIYEKCNKIGYTNCEGVSLLPTTYKIVSIVPVSVLNPYLDKIIVDRHCGFLCNRPITDQIFCIIQTPGKMGVHQLFIDSVNRSIVQYSQ
jgi:hypothetical protein